MSGDSGQEKTEQATDKRMKEVREKGQLSRSQDMTAWIGVGAAAVMLPGTIDSAARAGTEQMFTIAAVAQNPDPARAVQAMESAFGSLGATLTPMLMAIAVAVMAAAAAQGGIRFKKFKPEFEHFNPVSGVKRLFGTQALWNGTKSLLKTAVVALVLWTVVQGIVPVLMSAGGLPISALQATATGGVTSLIQFAVAAGVVLALADVFVVSKRNRKKTRMTKKEVMDEHKNSDGDPHIKAQRRARQMALGRNRMMAAVPDADVVMVNPTHYAVALKYEPGKSAPRVVAKGAGIIATRIREEAESSSVPMVKDVPLTRALHSACEIGQEIPVEFYDQIAGVLAFVMALKRRGQAKGVHTVPRAAARG